METQELLTEYDIQQLKEDPSYVRNLQEEQYVEAVKFHKLVLSFVPFEKRTYNLCLESVTHHWESMRFVPTEFRTPDLCEIAFISSNMEVPCYWMVADIYNDLWVRYEKNIS